MNNYSLPADDLPPENYTVSDRFLTRELEVCLKEYFDAECDRHDLENANKKASLLGPLLSRCQCSITTNADMTTLVIRSPNTFTNWRILDNIIEIAPLLEKLAIAKIRVFSPFDTEAPLEVRVSEMDVYQYSG
ncbi:MAG: hypothetical protein F6K35_35670 [Okeania sp. SIO2H7]|nr:hypothetical protein [Okeania sp. SIO2H7]